MKTGIIKKIVAIILFFGTFIITISRPPETLSFSYEDYINNILAQDRKNSAPSVLGEGTSPTLLAHPSAPVLAAPPALFSIDGEITGATLETADDIMTFVRIVDMDGAGSTGSSTWVSTTLQLVGGKYLWEADLGSVRSNDFSGYFIFGSDDRYEVEVFGPGGLLSQYVGDIADVEAHDPLSADPVVPAITVLPVTGDAVPEAELRILTPTTGQTFSESRVTFTGSGPANTLLDVYIVGTNIRANVDTNENGNWSWAPGSDIPPGEHVLRVEYKVNGEALSAEMKFSIIVPPETGIFDSYFLISCAAGFVLVLCGVKGFSNRRGNLNS